MSAASQATSRGPLGYRSAGYAESLGHLGRPVRLEGSGGFLLERDVPGSDLRDACGPYPLFSCADWGALAADLGERDDLVAVVAVLDPLASPARADLERAFPDLLKPFKRHFVADLTADFEGARSHHHRKEVRRALRKVDVVRAEDPADFGAEWSSLYASLVSRHRFASAPADFSREGLEAQLALDGVSYYRALVDGECAAACVFLRQGPHTYYHLGAANQAGRKAGASYALVDAALRDAAADGVRTADLGGSASLAEDGQDGLSRFKSGWSTDSVVASLAGRILDREAYRKLTRDTPDTGFFPAYRAPRREAES